MTDTSSAPIHKRKGREKGEVRGTRKQTNSRGDTVNDNHWQVEYVDSIFQTYGDQTTDIKTPNNNDDNALGESVQHLVGGLSNTEIEITVVQVSLLLYPDLRLGGVGAKQTHIQAN